MRFVCLGFNFQFLCNMYGQILKNNPQTILSTKKIQQYLLIFKENIDLCLVFSVVIFKVFKLSLGD